MQYIISLRMHYKYYRDSNAYEATKVLDRLRDIAKMLDCKAMYSRTNNHFMLVSDEDITQKVEYDLAIEWIKNHFDIVSFDDGL